MSGTIIINLNNSTINDSNISGIIGSIEDMENGFTDRKSEEKKKMKKVTEILSLCPKCGGEGKINGNENIFTGECFEYLCPRCEGSGESWVRMGGPVIEPCCPIGRNGVSIIKRQTEIEEND